MRYNIAYEAIIGKTYKEAVAYLLQKYGAATDDYFREASYTRFLRGEIKKISRGNYSRTADGLYCHHIDEYKELNISDGNFIKANQLPFALQKKERLVYCNLVEHTILHVLIAKETSLRFGYPGYAVYLKPLLIEWYVEQSVPQLPWMKNCYNQSFLTVDEAVHIIRRMEQIIGEINFTEKERQATRNLY